MPICCSTALDLTGAIIEDVAPRTVRAAPETIDMFSLLLVDEKEKKEEGEDNRMVLGHL